MRTSHKHILEGPDRYAALGVIYPNPNDDNIRFLTPIVRWGQLENEDDIMSGYNRAYIRAYNYATPDQAGTYATPTPIWNRRQTVTAASLVLQLLLLLVLLA